MKKPRFTEKRGKGDKQVYCSRLTRLLAAFAILVLLLTAAPSAFARGSFGGGGRSFGGFGGGRSFGGGRGFGGGFGGPRPSFTPAPRPSFTPPPRPAFAPAPVSTAPRPSFAPAPAAGTAQGSFGKGGNVGSRSTNPFSASAGGGGSFGRAGTAGSRTFTSIGSHPNAAPPPPVGQSFGRSYAPAYNHPYYYGGRPANVYFTGGYADYSFGYYRHPYLGWYPWSPVFYYNPPIYGGNGYVSGGFSFARFLLGLVFWGVVIAVVVAIARRIMGSRPA